MDTESRRVAAGDAGVAEPVASARPWAATGGFVAPSLDTVRVGIVGLGYVGLPLAVEFGKRYATVGFDIRAERVAELNEGFDATLEVDAAELAASSHHSDPAMYERNSSTYEPGSSPRSQ